MGSLVFGTVGSGRDGGADARFACGGSVLVAVVFSAADSGPAAAVLVAAPVFAVVFGLPLVAAAIVLVFVVVVALGFTAVAAFVADGAAVRLVGLARAAGGFFRTVGSAGSRRSIVILGVARRMVDNAEFMALAALVIAFVAVAMTAMAVDIVLGEDATSVTMWVTLLAADEIFATGARRRLRVGTSPAGTAPRLARAVTALAPGAFLAVVRLPVLALPAVAPLAVPALPVVAFLAVPALALVALADVFLVAALFVPPAAVARCALAVVTDSVATDLPPVTISYGKVYSTVGHHLHTTRFRVHCAPAVWMWPAPAA